MSKAAVDDKLAQTEGLSFQMSLCCWGWAVAFTLSCGLILMGEPWSMELGMLLMTVGNFFSFSKPMENKAGELTPNPSWTEPVSKRRLAQIAAGVVIVAGLAVVMVHWILDSPEAKAKAMRFVSHPMVVVPFWAGMIRLLFGRWRRARMARK